MLGKAGVLTMIAVCAPLMLGGCGPRYSPNVYSSDAVQHANKVDQGLLIGVRTVRISADATVATATLGAAGGIAASQVGEGAIRALSTLGGTVAGGVVGNDAGHVEDSSGFEYVVRKTNGELLSVTQKDAVPLAIGQHVLIIEGPQARIVPDYTISLDEGVAAPKAVAQWPRPERVESASLKSEPPLSADTVVTAHDKEDPAAVAPGSSKSDAPQSGSSQ